MRTKARTNGQISQSPQSTQNAQNPPKAASAGGGEQSEPKAPKRQPAGIDELTGVWNRSGFVAAATPMFRSCQRRDAPVALAYFDFYVDGTTIPTPGDPTVDRVLVAMSELMRKAFRASDIVGRIDPLRFAVLLPDCTDEALAAVDGVRTLTDESTSQLKLAAGMVRNVAGGTLDDLMFTANERTKQIKREQLAE
jgi:diguanylate cyclase (GGDEF)-like protein